MLMKKSSSKAATLAEEAASTLQPKAEVAAEKVSAAAEQAATAIAEAVKPAIEQAKEKIGPALQDAKDSIAPIAQQAVEEGRTRGRSAAVKMGIADEPKSSHKVRNLIIALGLAGVAAFVYKKFTGRNTAPDWTMSPTPDSEPAPMRTGSDDAATGAAASASTGSEATAAAGPVDGSDTAPTAPLASEETVESPVPTSPDDPLVKKDI